MESSLYQLTEAGLQQQPMETFKTRIDAPEGNLWLRLRGADRREMIDLLEDLSPLEKPIRRLLNDPGGSNRFRIYNQVAFLELPVIPEKEASGLSYLTYVIKDKLVVTLSPPNLNLLTILEEELEGWSFRTGVNRALLLYLLLNALYDQHARFVRETRLTIKEYRIRLSEDPESVDGQELLQLKHWVLLLSTAIEEQYAVLGFLGTMDWTKQENRSATLLGELTQNLNHLVRSLDRAEDRLDDLEANYTIQLQEKTNRRLNVLTIVQAIFVPLTFVAGVYGMNFDHMPELGWKWAYPAFWGLILLISAFSLTYFYRKGWFE